MQDGQKGVEAKYIQTPEYHQAWKVQARDVLARAEFRKRKLTQRVRTTHYYLCMAGVIPRERAGVVQIDSCGICHACVTFEYDLSG